MIKVVGVRFRQTCKMYYFSPGEFAIRTGDGVIVETARGIEYGTVVMGITEMTDDKVVQPLKPVIRIATKEDQVVRELNSKKEEEAFKICEEKIARHGLEMKLVDVEYTFDGNKVLFYFIADGRIDFRELVKDLASVFRTRIELRQIGVRDETKAKGGIGICGRVLCCHSYLSDFAPVSIKMAKEQNLSLNPSKISGVCGRLMCCLKNEQETYEYLNSQLPSIGETVTTDDGFRGDVQNVNVLRQLVKVLVQVDRDEKELREYKVEQLQFRGKKKKAQPVTGCDGCGEGCGGCGSACGTGQATGGEETEAKAAAGEETAVSAAEPEQASEQVKIEEMGAERPGRELRNPENRENRENREKRENRDRGRDRGQQQRREARGEENRRTGEKRNYHENANRSRGEGRPNGENGSSERRRDNNNRPRRDNRNFENRRVNGEQRSENRRNERNYENRSRENQNRSEAEGRPNENRRETGGEQRRRNTNRRYQGNHRQRNTDSQQNNE